MIMEKVQKSIAFRMAKQSRKALESLEDNKSELLFHIVLCFLVFIDETPV